MLQKSSVPPIASIPQLQRQQLISYTMKVAIFALCLVCVAARPNSRYGAYESPELKLDYAHVTRPELKVLPKEIIPILKQEMHDDNKGTYSLEVHTGDGSTSFESAKLKDLGNPQGLDVVKEGSYTFTSPEGKTFTVNWKSDENGFQAFGEHLPTAPPMSEEIRKSLEIPRIAEFQPNFKVVERIVEAPHRDYESPRYGYSRF